LLHLINFIIYMTKISPSIAYYPFLKSPHIIILLSNLFFPKNVFDTLFMFSGSSLVNSGKSFPHFLQKAFGVKKFRRISLTNKEEWFFFFENLKNTAFFKQNFGLNKKSIYSFLTQVHQLLNFLPWIICKSQVKTFFTSQSNMILKRGFLKVVKSFLMIFLCR